MGKQICLRCQEPITRPVDHCPRCGLPIGAGARNWVKGHRWVDRFAAMGGNRRKPGELSTFAKLKWLPFVFAIAMMIVTLAAVPGVVGVAAAAVVAMVALVTCSMIQSHGVAIAEAERAELDR